MSCGVKIYHKYHRTRQFENGIEICETCKVVICEKCQVTLSKGRTNVTVCEKCIPSHWNTPLPAIHDYHLCREKNNRTFCYVDQKQVCNTCMCTLKTKEEQEKAICEVCEVLYVAQ